MLAPCLGPFVFLLHRLKLFCFLIPRFWDYPRNSCWANAVVSIDNNQDYGY